MTEDEEKTYLEMIKSEIITKTAEKNPNMSEKQIAQEAEKISKDYNFDLRLLRRLLRVQVQKNQEEKLYDLDWDLQLNKAVEILSSPDFNDLLKSAKTVKQLQDEKNGESEGSDKIVVSN